MSIARAFTKRSKRNGDASDSTPGRSIITRKRSASTINRNLISSPVELISTTNMLSYNAPDIPNASLKHVSSSSSSSSGVPRKSADESDLGVSSPDLTDASSVESVSPTSPQPNHLSSYFAAANGVSPTVPPIPAPRPRRAVSTTSLNAKAQSPTTPSPAVPQRATSHSKQAHEQVARQRSLHNINSNPRGSNNTNEFHHRRSASREQRVSTDMFRVEEEPAHPFGKELEQLKEVVEEFGGVIAEAEMDEDLVYMRDHGLGKYSVGDYMTEIQPLFCGAYDAGFDQRLPAMNEVPAWI